MEEWQQLLEEGKRWHQAGKGQQAAACYQQILAKRPRQAEVLQLFGVLLFQSGQKQAGLEHMLQSAASFARTGKLAEAAAVLEQILAVHPHSIEAKFHLAQVREQEGKPEVAQTLLVQLTEARPDVAEAWAELAFLSFRQQEPEQAEAYLRQFLKLRSEDAQGWSNLGISLQHQQRLAEAEAVYEQAISLAPDDAQAHLNRAVLWLYQGKWQKGFQEYEWRLQRPQRKKELAWCAAIPQWQGELFSGKRLLVHHEQGFGDALQFCRYLPQVKARGGWVTLLTRQELVSLLERVAGVDAVVVQGDDLDCSDYDLYVPLLSLPLIFGTTVRSIPASIPYLSACEERKSYWRERIEQESAAGALRIGLLWAGSRYGWNDYQRSSVLEEWLALREVPGVSYFSLQMGTAAEQAVCCCKEWPIVDLGKDIQDFADTAALVENLDLIITVDTALAHVAGGLGKEVWILLPVLADWRWLESGETTAWYPQGRLFRQETSGDWTGVIRKAAKELVQRTTK
ncbi:tetratricopeptide repeat protein [Anaeromusa sp.]|uniref:tetratricopeptide repeat protein n=1 Tax=Anaeromusa sp. TaxID=1872520 RepID=UPI00262C39BC|nr:tetratricopeptide repeat protein [Anaeromusa sp.]MDD3157106.1 tetratricopeptide repeat protein [Anaeromusa sp.]